MSEIGILAVFHLSPTLRLLMQTFINSQFSYCPLIWMFHSRTLNNRINSLHGRALRLVYKDESLSFSELLDKDHSFSIHDKNLQMLAIEMYKIKHNLCPSFMQSIFSTAEKRYNLRNNPEFQTGNVRTVYNGTETISFRGPKTWELVPREIKESQTLNEFKNKIKRWKPIGCTCRLCKVFIPNLGFI